MTTPWRSMDVDERPSIVSRDGVRLYSLHAANLSGKPLFLKLFNGTDPTVGVTSPGLTMGVPVSGDAMRNPLSLSLHGMEFPLGLTIAGTTGVKDDATEGPGNNELIVDIEFDYSSVRVQS